MPKEKNDEQETATKVWLAVQDIVDQFMQLNPDQRERAVRAARAIFGMEE